MTLAEAVAELLRQMEAMYPELKAEADAWELQVVKVAVTKDRPYKAWLELRMAGCNDGEAIPAVGPLEKEDWARGPALVFEDVGDPFLAVPFCNPRAAPVDS